MKATIAWSPLSASYDIFTDKSSLGFRFFKAVYRWSRVVFGITGKKIFSRYTFAQMTSATVLLVLTKKWCSSFKPGPDKARSADTWYRVVQYYLIY